jgi:hypothetical protein
MLCLYNTLMVDYGDRVVGSLSNQWGCLAIAGVICLYRRPALGKEQADGETVAKRTACRLISEASWWQHRPSTRLPWAEAGGQLQHSSTHPSLASHTGK